jgi:hypothetical protein
MIVSVVVSGFFLTVILSKSDPKLPLMVVYLLVLDFSYEFLLQDFLLFVY